MDMRTIKGMCRIAGRIRSGWRWGPTLAVLAVHLSASAAWAQQTARIADDDKGLWQWGIALVLAGVICLVAFINPKRSHLT